MSSILKHQAETVLRPPRVDKSNPVDAYLHRFFPQSQDMMANVNTTVQVLVLGSRLTKAAGCSLPVCINEEDFNNSWVCSPYTALIPYCREEIGKIDNGLLRALLKTLTTAASGLVKALHINRLVSVNNWLLSTNLYPQQALDIDAMVDACTKAKARHGIMLRSLNRHSNGELMLALEKKGFLMLPSRQVYLFDLKRKDYRRSHNYAIDRKLLDKTPYQYVGHEQINTADYPRIAELYSQLYLQKYSRHNPHFTEHFIAAIAAHPYFQLEGFRNERGILDGVGGRFSLDGVTTLPIVGYDVGKPQRWGLYRMVMMASLLHAQRNALVFNASAGAAEFKRLRGAVAEIEYSAVYCRHLPAKQRWLWECLSKLLQKMFVPIMQGYQL